MKRQLILLFASLFLLTISAQKSKQNVRRKTQKTQVSKTRKNRNAGKKAPVYTNSSIKGLERERSAVQRKIKEQEKALRANENDVKKRLQDLLVLNSEIDQHQKSITGIEEEINSIEGNIKMLNSQLETLEEQLDERRKRYVKSMKYMMHRHSVQDKLMFIFSAKNLAQMYRRFRFINEYAAYQRAKGEQVRAKQTEIANKQSQLKQVKGHKNNLLYKGKQECAALQEKQDKQQEVVKGLKNQQRTIKNIISKQRQKDIALNAQIDKLVAEEVAKARARAAAEARRKAAEAAAAAKRRAEELAARKAAAEAAARENQRRIAEAKAREEKLKAEAREKAEAEAKAKEQAAQAEEESAKKRRMEQNARKAAEKAAKAEQAAKEAEQARLAAEKKAAVEKERNEKAIQKAKKTIEESQKLSTVDRMMSGGFEANKGRLPMPVAGRCRIVSHFGQYNVEGLKGVTLDNKGINILGQPGCTARSVYDGEVSGVFEFAGTKVVMVRHGAYISVYCNLKSVSVEKGQKVSTGQTLGTVGTDNILQFQLRKETAKLNPEAWIRR